MQLRAFTLTLIALGGLNLPAIAQAFDNETIPLDPATRAVTAQELLSNDKEQVSRIVGNGDVTSAETAIGGIVAHEAALQKVTGELATYLFAEQVPVCEPTALIRIANAASANALPSDREGIRSILVAARSLNLIDDVLIAPLLKYLPAYVPNEKPGPCLSDHYLQDFKKLGAQEGKKFKREHFNEKMAGILSSIKPSRLGDLAAYKTLYEIKWDKTPFSLSHAVEIIRALKDQSLPSAAPSIPTKFASTKRKKSGGLSNRLYLYSHFDATQVRYLSNIFYRFNYRVWNGDHSELIHYSKDNQIIERVALTPQEKFNAFVRQLHKEIENDAKLSLIFTDDIDFDDVAMAALESGALQGEAVNKVFEIEEFWNPKVSGWTKFLNGFQKYGSVAFFLMPPPFNTIASVSILFLQTVVVKDHSKDPTPDQKGMELW